MNKKAKAQLLSELGQLDVEREGILDTIEKRLLDGGHLTDNKVTGQVFLDTADSTLGERQGLKAKLCTALGINCQWGEDCHIVTTEPILGGDEGITTTISDINLLPRDGDAYKVTMSYEGLQVQYTAPMAVDLPTMLHRGYAALRVLRKGTINYHKD